MTGFMGLVDQLDAATEADVCHATTSDLLRQFRAHRACQHHDPKRAVSLERVHQVVVDLDGVSRSTRTLGRIEPPARAAVVQLIAALQLFDDLFLVHLAISFNLI